MVELSSCEHSPAPTSPPEVKLVRPLGGGGMGSVWLAEHEARGIEVAVKLVSSDLGRS